LPSEAAARERIEKRTETTGPITHLSGPEDLMRNRQDNDKPRLSPDKFLNEDLIHLNLVLSALYLFCFEVLEYSIIEDTKDYLVEKFGIEEASRKITSWDELLDDMEHRQARVTSAYEKRLTGLDRNKSRASRLLLKEIGVLDAKDVDDIEEIRKHRNQIAHELPWLLVDEQLDVNLQHLVRIREILGKLEEWQISMETAVSPELVGKEMRSLRIVVVDHILSTALSIVSHDEESTA
jgi:hypothetical protein